MIWGVSSWFRSYGYASVYDSLIERVVERAKKLTVKAADQNPDLGPVCNRAQDGKVREYLEIGRSEGKLLVGGKRLDGEGFFIEPTIFGDIRPGARLAQEEVFGPVLAAIRVKDFDEGLKVANDTLYGLTGALFSNDRSRIQLARRDFHVGRVHGRHPGHVHQPEFGEIPGQRHHLWTGAEW